MDIRIVKSSAEQALSDENAKLENQMDACQAQVEAVGDISLEGMEGAAAEAATQTIHMHKAVVESHYSLYESLRSANEKNKRAVSGLYPTEGDVVDTKVAEQRLQEAQSEIARLRQEERRDVSFARQQNQQAQRDGGSAESLIDVQSISDGYSSLIASQQETAQYYQKSLTWPTSMTPTRQAFMGRLTSANCVPPRRPSSVIRPQAHGAIPVGQILPTVTITTRLPSISAKWHVRI